MNYTLRFFLVACVAVGSSTSLFAADSQVRPYEVAIPDEVIKRVTGRFTDARFPDQLADGGWSLGASASFMQDFATYMSQEYDWRQAEQKLNAFPQFKVQIDDVDVHFYHVKGEGPSPVPLILTHGWPGSVFEFLDVIGPLTQPSQFGGDANDAFTVVIPSLPGFGFSDAPKDRAIGTKTTANIWNHLMTDVLGYERYAAQGGDLGSLVTSQLAVSYPEKLIGVHLNLVPWAARSLSDLTAEEKTWLAQAMAFTQAELAYFGLQATKPTTPPFALVDSPMGTAAWILEKFYAWSDRGSVNGKITDAFTMEQLATLVSIYTLTETVDTSMWFYHGFVRESQGVYLAANYVDVPTGVAIFPKDLLNGRPPYSWVAAQYDLRQWTEMPSGGHFAALEEPELFVKDVRNFFRSLREKR